MQLSSRRNFLQTMGGLLVLPFLRAEEPEVILYNGNIWTVDETQRRVIRDTIKQRSADGILNLRLVGNPDTIPLQ